MRIRLLLLPLILLAALTPPTTERKVILWAWERPEDLTFIDTEKVGVAFLAKTIYLRGDKVIVKPRMQPLKLAPGTKLTAVVRIETRGTETARGTVTTRGTETARGVETGRGTETARGLETSRDDIPSFSASQLERVSREIRNLSAVSQIQIDFDATLSERNFYRSLLTEVRRQLPSSVGLSMTALASWCAGDDWLRDLPIDEAVPMLFRLGVEQQQFQRRLETGRPFESQMCRNAAGVSTDEPVKPPAVSRLYVFSPAAWTKESFARAMEVYKR